MNRQPIQGRWKRKGLYYKRTVSSPGRIVTYSLFFITYYLLLVIHGREVYEEEE